MLEDAICNILNNAIDFSKIGQEILISCEKNGDKAIIICKDSGVGIPNYAVEKVFQKFFSLARPDSKKKGTGLGLAFVKEVIEVHKGSISINNCPAGGVEVIIQLDLLS